MLEFIDGKVVGEYLMITLQGKNPEEVNSAAARQFAYKERHKFGFSNAGIENAAGYYPVDLTKDNPETPDHKGLPLQATDMMDISKRVKDLGYRQTYRLTRSLM